MRRNAALGITRFGDNSGRAELLAALEPFTVTAPMDGTIIRTLPAGSKLSVGAMLARLQLDDKGLKEVRAPLPGTIEKVFVSESTRSVRAMAWFQSEPTSAVWRGLARA